MQYYAAMHSIWVFTVCQSIQRVRFALNYSLLNKHVNIPTDCRVVCLKLFLIVVCLKCLKRGDIDLRMFTLLIRYIHIQSCYYLFHLNSDNITLSAGFPQALQIMENLENHKKSSIYGKIMKFERNE